MTWVTMTDVSIPGAMLRSQQVHTVVSGVKKFRRIFMIYVSKNDAFCWDVETHFESSPLAIFKRKNSGHIFMIYASKNEAFCCEVEMHFQSSLVVIFARKISVCIFTISVSKN